MALETALAELLEAAVARRLAPLVAEVGQLRRLVDERLPARWLSRRELATQLGVAVDTVDRRIAAGDGSIEVQRLGRAVRVRLVPPVQPAEIAALAAAAIAVRPSSP